MVEIYAQSMTWEYVIEIEHITRKEQKADILTNAFGMTMFNEMRDFIGIQDVLKDDFIFKGDNVDLNLKIT